MNIAEIRAKFPQYADVPDGELVRGLHKKFYADVPYTDFLKKIDFRKAVDPTADMGKLEQFNAGMGKAFVDIGEGAAQLVGAGPSAEETKNRKALDAPLMNTGAGLAGNISGNIAALAPLSVIPGANTVAGATALGATVGALQPAESARERIMAMLVGGGIGGGTQAAAGPGARRLGEWAADRAAEKAAQQSQNSVRDATLRAGQAEGFTLPASVADPTAVNKVLDSVAGKAAVGQEAAVRNQRVADALARRAAGLGPNAPMTEQAMRDARRNAAGPYRELTAISPQAAADMEALQAARLESRLQWQHHARQGDPAAYRAATAADAQAQALEQSLLQEATNVGRADLLPALREARTRIARIHDVERALNVGTGSVDSSVFGRMVDQGRPLTGELRTIGEFQQAFPSYMRAAEKIPTPGVSKIAAALSGGGGYAIGGMPGAVAAAVPFTVPPAARSLSLRLGKTGGQSYNLTAAERIAEALTDQAVRDRVGTVARSLALPAIPLTTPSN